MDPRSGTCALPGGESLNTPLFVGFPGFVSKLWLAHDENGVYRGFYQWDGSQLADTYVRALWWVLALVSVRGSIRYVVLPALRRDDVLADPTVLDGIAASQRQAWWRLTAVERLGGGDVSTEGRVIRRALGPARWSTTSINARTEARPLRMGSSGTTEPISS